MRKASAPTLFLVALLVAAAIGGATYGVAAVVGVDDDDDEVASTTTTAPVDAAVLAADQVAVSGTAVTIAVVDAQLDEVAVPAVTTPAAGLGAGATFEAALVDGEDSAIVWDAGRPLVFGADTPLRIDPAPLSLLANQAAILLAYVDGSVHRILPGDYQIAAPVAVSTGGLATSHDTIGFTATDGTTVSFTGAAASTIAPTAMAVTGPGQVIIEGALRIRHPDGRIDDVTRVELPQGSFRLSFSPRADGGGYDLTEALLEGAIATA